MMTMTMTTTLFMPIYNGSRCWNIPLLKTAAAAAAAEATAARRRKPERIRRLFSQLTTATTTSNSSKNKCNSGSSISNNNNTNEKIGTLKVWGPDRNGIVARCTQILGGYGCNIMKSEHWTCKSTPSQSDMFFQRLEFLYDPQKFDAPTKLSCQHDLEDGLRVLQQQQQQQQQQQLQQRHHEHQDRHDTESEGLSPTTSMLHSSMNWRDRRMKVGIMVSRIDHCLWELLLRHSAHELEHLDVDIHTVVSNHDALRGVAETFGIPFHHTPLHRDMTLSEKTSVEQRQLELLHDVDVVVLARYMQVLSPQFLEHFPPDGIINIHHSFLPAFMGPRPYQSAHDRGVKLIGATAHYVTSDLDDGPIIDQDVVAVSHRDSVKQLQQKGRILERSVLFRALEAHLADRTIIYKNRTIVFGD